MAAIGPRGCNRFYSGILGHPNGIYQKKYDKGVTGILAITVIFPWLVTPNFPIEEDQLAVDESASPLSN